MTALGYLALLGWIPLCLTFFALTPPRQAFMISTLGGWLLLPMAGLHIAGPLVFSKLTAISLGAASAALLFDGPRVLSWRPKWFDVPMAGFCLWPLISASLNGVPASEGGGTVLQHLIDYGSPYVLGRVYFTGRGALGELLRAICLSALLYLPLVWYEMRMSPNLHHDIYGFQQHSFVQTWRQGGWRPQVFFQHGLALALFIGLAALSACALWFAGSRRSMAYVGPRLALVLLFGTAVLCRSAGALGLLTVGLAVLASSGRGRRRWPTLLLLAVGPSIMLGRVAGVLASESIIGAVSGAYGGERVDSLRFRLENEDLLLARAHEKILSGWGPAGRYRTDAGGNDVVRAADGLWVILLGQYGIVGLLCFVGSLVLPALLALRIRSPLRDLRNSALVVLCLALHIGLYLVDFIFNAMMTPVALVTAGALASASTIADVPPDHPW